MKRNTTIMLIVILLLAIVVVYISIPNNPGLHFELGPIRVDQDFDIKQGLDLQGGLQVMLEADLPPGEEPEPESLEVAAKIIESRVNALGVVEPLVQTQGNRRIIIELPGVEDSEQAIATIKETGLLEFVDAGDIFLPPGSIIRTTFPLLESEGATTQSVAPEPGDVAPADNPITSTLPFTNLLEIEPPSAVVTTGESASGAVTTAVSAEAEPGAPTGPDQRTPTITDRVFATVLTGAHLSAAAVQRDETTGQFMIAFELTEEGGQIFADYTGRNVNKVLSIVLDKEVISSPVIRSQIPDGQGVIEGDFTLDEARNLVIQLRYGALPVPLRIETTRAIGPTLGQDSVQRSIQAGAVGLLIVFLFMLIYYRIPGLLADLALLLYGLLNLAVYKVGWPVLLLISLVLVVSYIIERKDLWPLVLGGILALLTFGLATAGFTGVTLTLPAVTGFILSTGMAVDANILVFERMKEELRAGRSLNSAVEAGFSRAWTSIRDSNISTLITCAILFYFGSTFGAGAVRGFAITLALGVVINMFTAITVTRTLMRSVFEVAGDKLQGKEKLLGL